MRALSLAHSLSQAALHRSAIQLSASSAACFLATLLLRSRPGPSCSSLMAWRADTGDGMVTAAPYTCVGNPWFMPLLQISARCQGFVASKGKLFANGRERPIRKLMACRVGAIWQA